MFLFLNYNVLLVLVSILKFDIVRSPSLKRCMNIVLLI